MKKLSLITLVLLSSLFIFSCGDTKKKEVKTEKKETKTEEKKTDHFAEVDTDGDGKISKIEFEAHGEAEYKEKDTNGNGKIEKDECGKFDLFNSDKDDFLSKEEYTKGHNLMFAKIDTDGDGFFNKEDKENYNKEMMLKKLGKIFNRADENSDGKATKAEFMAMSKENFTEKDKNKDGLIQKEECGGFATLSPDGKDLSEGEYLAARDKAFNSIDANNDGSFTKEEFIFFKKNEKKKHAKKMH